MAAVSEKPNSDVEQGRCPASRAAGSRRCSDAEAGGGSSDDEILGVSDEKRRDSSESDDSSADLDLELDLESGIVGEKAHLGKVKRNCRICHLSLDASNPESGTPLELGCSCKEDLAAAHKQCAEAWFKIRGNKTCEICGSTAKNVVGVSELENADNWNDTNDSAVAGGAPVHSAETRRFWQGHRFLNFLLACMVFAFVISWLFHFNVPS